MRRSALPVDQSTAEYVVSRVRETLLSGRQVGASMLVQRSDTLDVVGVKKSVPGRRVVLPHLLAGLTSTWTPEGGRVEAIGVAGRFQLRRRGQSLVGVALVFLEWEDLQLVALAGPARCGGAACRGQRHGGLRATETRFLAVSVAGGPGHGATGFGCRCDAPRRSLGRRAALRPTTSFTESGRRPAPRGHRRACGRLGPLRRTTARDR